LRQCVADRPEQGRQLAEQHDVAIPGPPAWWAHLTLIYFKRPSARFTLVFNASGELVEVIADYRVAPGLTEHALAWIDTGKDDSYDVCCRRARWSSTRCCAHW